MKRASSDEGRDHPQRGRRFRPRREDNEVERPEVMEGGEAEEGNNALAQPSDSQQDGQEAEIENPQAANEAPAAAAGRIQPQDAASEVVTYTTPRNFAERLMSFMQRGWSQNEISWVGGGRGVALNQRNLNNGTSMSGYFHVTQWSTFIRNMNRWGFERIQKPPYHVPDGFVVYECSLFKQDEPHLAKHMRMDSDVAEVYEKHGKIKCSTRSGRRDYACRRSAGAKRQQVRPPCLQATVLPSSMGQGSSNSTICMAPTNEVSPRQAGRQTPTSGRDIVRGLVELSESYMNLPLASQHGTIRNILILLVTVGRQYEQDELQREHQATGSLTEVTSMTSQPRQPQHSSPTENAQNQFSVNHSPTLQAPQQQPGIHQQLIGMMSSARNGGQGATNPNPPQQTRQQQQQQQQQQQRSAGTQNTHAPNSSHVSSLLQQAGGRSNAIDLVQQLAGVLASAGGAEQSQQPQAGGSSIVAEQVVGLLASTRGAQHGQQRQVGGGGNATDVVQQFAGLLQSAGGAHQGRQPQARGSSNVNDLVQQIVGRRTTAGGAQQGQQSQSRVPMAHERSRNEQLQSPGGQLLGQLSTGNTNELSRQLELLSSALRGSQPNFRQPSQHVHDQHQPQSEAPRNNQNPISRLVDELFPQFGAPPAQRQLATPVFNPPSPAITNPPQVQTVTATSQQQQAPTPEQARELLQLLTSFQQQQQQQQAGSHQNNTT